MKGPGFWIGNYGGPEDVSERRDWVKRKANIRYLRISIRIISSINLGRVFCLKNGLLVKHLIDKIC